MSSPSHPKRRRVDSIGIHKPFVSPLKRATSTAETGASPQATPLRTSNLRNVTTPSTPSTPYPHDPEVLEVQQAIRHLERRIRELRAQNTILQQATTVTPTASTQPSRLETKWRKASQAAAEQVYSDFAARIRDNGGYTAFLKQQSDYKPFADQNDGQDDTKGDEEDWRDEMGDVLIARGRKQRRRENEDNSRKKEEDAAEEEQEEEEEQELGMGCMLQVLNIPPEVIGWDEKEQAWK